MKKLIIIAAVAALGYWHVNGFFSTDTVHKFLINHNMNVMSGKDEACDAYADNISVDIIQEQPDGHWEVSGGKAEICGFSKQSAAQMTVLQARVNSEITDLVVEKDGMFAANATYTQTTSISANGIPDMQAISHDSIRLKHGLIGDYKIVKINSQSRVKIR